MLDNLRVIENFYFRHGNTLHRLEIDDRCFEIPDADAEVPARLFPRILRSVAPIYGCVDLDRFEDTVLHQLELGRQFPGKSRKKLKGYLKTIQGKYTELDANGIQRLKSVSKSSENKSNPFNLPISEEHLKVCDDLERLYKRRDLLGYAKRKEKLDFSKESPGLLLPDIARLDIECVKARLKLPSGWFDLSLPPWPAEGHNECINLKTCQGLYDANIERMCSGSEISDDHTLRRNPKFLFCVLQCISFRKEEKKQIAAFNVWNSLIEE